MLEDFDGDQSASNEMIAKNAFSEFNSIQSNLDKAHSLAEKEVEALIKGLNPQELPKKIYDKVKAIESNFQDLQASSNTKMEGLKEEFESATIRQDELRGAYKISISGNNILLEDSFQKTKDIKEIAESLDSFAGGAGKGLGKAAQGTWQMYLQRMIGFTGYVMGQSTSVVAGGDYNVYDAWMQMLENNINYDAVPTTETAFLKDGDWSLSEGFALAGDITGYVANVKLLVKFLRLIEGL